MTMNKTSLALMLSCTALVSAAVQAADGRLEFRVAANADDTASFTCIHSGSGICVVKVGLPSDKEAEKFDIPEGTTISLPNPQKSRQYCVAMAEGAQWPACGKGDAGGMLSNSRTHDYLQWDGRNK